mmetsp:Transcript_15715/g.36096  ORF Transcript_15715/g.36096 Transcript_15715/m.36096 type:complete len:549 (-) Transcript_15715:393-2039(-)
MQDASATNQEIEEKLSERLLGDDDYGNDHNNTGILAPGGFGIHDNGTNHLHIDGSVSAAIQEGGEIVVDPGAAGFGLPFRQQQQQQQQQDGPVRPEYRDTPFALAFLVHLGAVGFFAVSWGTSSLRQDASETHDDNDNGDHDIDGDGGSVYLSGLLWLSLFTCLLSIWISAVSLKVMMHHAESLIQTSLFGSCGFMLVLAVLFVLDGVYWFAAVWGLSFLLTGWYAWSVWHRIPFASANLRTALSAIQTNGGVCALAYGIAFLANLWTVLWVLAVVGVVFKESTCVAGVCKPHASAAAVAFLVLSFYWTIQVFQNVLHVTVSGVVGTWWFAPQDALSVFSPAIVDSFRRATTYSFGSICMGSLLVAIVQTLEAMARSARKNNRGGILLCILECVLRFLSRIAVYFNRWAYCYVGLYGFDYVSSGKKAMELFEARGWTTIVTDNLVQRSLSLVAIVVGAISGFVGMLLAKTTGCAVATLGEDHDGTVFLACFGIGTSMAVVLMRVVLSAVDTVVVAFAEAPAEFQTHHPALSNHMVQKWRQVFPNECGF